MRPETRAKSEEKVLSVKGKIYKMKSILPTISFVIFSILLAFLPTNRLSAGSHQFEITIQNCSHARTFARIILEKRKIFRPLSYYEQIEFKSPVAMEIVLEAYATNQREAEFSNSWFERCQEISCSDFWASLDDAIKEASR